MQLWYDFWIRLIDKIYYYPLMVFPDPSNIGVQGGVAAMNTNSIDAIILFVTPYFSFWFDDVLFPWYFQSALLFYLAIYFLTYAVAGWKSLLEIIPVV